MIAKLKPEKQKGKKTPPKQINKPDLICSSFQVFGTCVEPELIENSSAY